MALMHAFLALALSFVSLVCSAYFLAHAQHAADSPIFISWITLSAALFYTLLCFAIISYLHQRGQQQPHKDVESSAYRISRRSNDNTESSVETTAANQHHSASTFYYCGSSFAAIHLNSAMSTPRTPRTVIRHPLRSHALLPPAPVVHAVPSPQLSTKLQRASKFDLSFTHANVVHVTPSASQKKRSNEMVRQESVSKILRATSRRTGGVQEVDA